MLEASLGLSAMNFLILLALCSTRIMVTLFVLAASQEEMLPGAARSAFALLVGAFVAAGQPVSLSAQWSAPMLALLATKEALIGLMLGFAASTVFWVAQNVGELIDNLAGFTNVRIQDPSRDEQGTPLSNYLGQLMIALFYVVGGMLGLLQALFESFAWWPLAHSTPNVHAVLKSFAISQVDTLAETTLKMAMPIIALLLLVDLGLALVAKEADKLEPASLSQPIKGAVSLLVLAISLSLIVEHLHASLAMTELSKTLQSLLVR